MSLTYGFYNSINEDRKYNASQMSKLFDGVLNDGIFMSIGDKFMVTANSGMNISIGTGRAWFDHTWTLNDSILVLPVSVSEILLNRIDVVVLEVNNTEAVRANSIKIIKGAGATVPVAPDLVNNSEVHQYPLAHIYVGVGVTEILQANITNYVGTAETPFATGVMQTMSIDALVAQWQSEWDVWSADQQADYVSWFNNINALLGTEPATNLQIQINELSYDARIAYIAEKIRDRNLVKNGDFSSGAAGWSTLGNLTVENGVLTGSGVSYGNATQLNKMIIGNEYYIRMEFSSYSSGALILLGSMYETSYSFSGGGLKSCNTVSKTTTLDIYNDLFNGTVDNIAFIDLTSIFGAGNEPTKEETDAAIDLLGGWTGNKSTPLVISDLAEKTTAANADMFALMDSADSNISKKFSWTNLKAGLKAYFDTLYSNYTHPTVEKTTPVDADNVAISDSAASGALKKLTWANIKATLKTYFDNLYALASHTHSYLPLAGGTINGNIYTNGRLTVNNSNPIIGMQDTDGRSLFFYLNQGTFYMLRGAGINSETWGAYNSQWPFTLNVENNDIVVGGNFTAMSNITAYSDERLKDNIVTIPNALEKVLALRGVEFDRNGVHNIGLIAQEVQKVIPEIVLENSDEMKTLSVAYANLVGLLIEGMKEQQKQIDELKAKVN